MRNNEIIYAEVNAKYHTPEQRRAILALAYTPEQIAAKAKEIRFEDVPEEQQGEELEKLLLSELFHTFQGWKKRGKSVKAGEKAVINTRLWKLDDRPDKTRKPKKDKEPDALIKAAEEQDENGDYYKAPAHLFHIGQVEASRPAPAGRFKSIEEIKEYNRMLADQRKAAKAAAEQTASTPTPAPAKEEATKKATAKPSKKASKPTTRKATKPAAPKKAAKSAEKAPAAVQIVAAPATIDPAPVKQLDFESIAAGLLA